MRLLTFLIFLAALALPTVAFAEIQTFTATHTYSMGDDDSRNTARQKCLAEAKRKILEQVGVYLESKSQFITSSQSTTTGSTKSPQTTNEERQQIMEQIDTLSAGVMRTEVIKEVFGEVNGRLQITLTLKSEVDPDDMRKQLAERRVDQGVREQVMEQQQRVGQLEEKLRIMLEEMRTTARSAPRGTQKLDVGIPDVTAIRERANSGDAEAQAVLGWMYQNGKGVLQDDTQAIGWFRKAAAQNDAAAQFKLGPMYAVGRGVPKDYVQAYKWVNLASKHGIKGADFFLEMYAKQMTPAQIAEAQRLAQQCEAQQFKGC